MNTKIIKMAMNIGLMIPPWLSCMFSSNPLIEIHELGGALEEIGRCGGDQSGRFMVK